MFPLKDNIPTRRFPVVTVTLIVLNAVAYLVLQPKTGIDFSGGSLDEASLTRYAAIPFELSNPGSQCAFADGQVACGTSSGGQLPTALTVLTSMFTHAGLLHLGGNMLFLWIFGNNVEDAMGRVKFLGFYLLAGVAALAGQTLIDPDSVVPTLGASGAVAGVLGGYIVLYPRARVVTAIVLVFFVTFVQIPAILVLGFWFLQQVAFGWLDLTDPTGEGGGVAYFAHVGGFVLGVLLVKLLATYRAPEADAPRRA